MTERFDGDLLDAFAHQFYGYGNYGGEIWFVGIEEGGGGSFADVAHRLDKWRDRGQRELENLQEWIPSWGLDGKRPPVQSTWNKLMRVLLCRAGEDNPHIEQVRRYQHTELGRTDSNHCLLELRPLPSPSIHNWLYAEHSDLPYVADRGLYEHTCLQWRIPHLQQRLREHRPKVVLFYGVKCRQEWEEIAGVEWSETFPRIYTGRSASTLFVRTPHPTSHGVTKAQFHQIGQLVRTACNV